MDTSLQDNNEFPGDAQQKAAANQLNIDGSDENKTIGELIREANMLQAGIPVSKTNDDAEPESQKPASAIHISRPETKETDVKGRTELKESKEDEIDKGEKETKLEKQNFELFINSFRKFVNILREREDGKLNAIVPEGKAGIIMQGVNAIEKLLGSGEMDFMDINAEIAKITSVMETIGSGRRHSGLHEDTENLAKAKIALGQIELGCHDVIIRTVKDGSPEIKMIMASIGKLFNVVQEKKLYVAKLLADFDGFHRR